MYGVFAENGMLTPPSREWGLQLFQQTAHPLRPRVLDDVVERIEPLLRLDRLRVGWRLMS